MEELRKTMIQEFSIRNYLSIKDTQTLSFVPRKRNLDSELFTAEAIPGVRLLKSAMIYGANASGKSNILKGLQFLRNLTVKRRERGEDTGFVPFKFSDETVNEAGEFEIIFYEGGNKFRYFLKVSSLEIIEEELNYYPGQSPATIYYRKTIKENEIQIDIDGEYGVNKAERDMIRARVLPNVTVLSTLSEVSPQKEYILRAYNWFFRMLKPIIEPTTMLNRYTSKLLENETQIEDKITQLMKKADFNVEKIITEETFLEIGEEDLEKLSSELPGSIVKKIRKEKGIKSKELKLQHKINNAGKEEFYLLDHELESRGTWRYFGLSGPILETLMGHKILFIDEIDSSLHPDILNYLYSLFLVNSQGAQIIFTLHSRELLSDSELQRRDSIWFTEKQGDGSTELYSIADITGVRNDKNFGNLYKSGRFGAKPTLGSLHLELEYEN